MKTFKQLIKEDLPPDHGNDHLIMSPNQSELNEYEVDAWSAQKKDVNDFQHADPKKIAKRLHSILNNVKYEMQKIDGIIDDNDGGDAISPKINQWLRSAIKKDLQKRHGIIVYKS